MQISIGSIKKKPGNKIEFRCILEVWMGKGEMTEIPTHSLQTVFKSLSYLIEIPLHVTYQNPILENQQNIQYPIHEATRQGWI